MAIKKTGNVYMNDRLFAKLLTAGGAYFLELKNGVRVPISSDDFSALTDGLTSVSGTYYYDKTLISKGLTRGGKYILEFRNGTQISVSQSVYNGITADFLALGDELYNDSVVTALTATEDGRFYAQFANGTAFGISEEQYDAATGGEPGPTPGELTPFYDGTDGEHEASVISGIVIDPTVENVTVDGQTMSLADYLASVLVGNEEGFKQIALIGDYYGFFVANNNEGTPLGTTILQGYLPTDGGSLQIIYSDIAIESYGDFGNVSIGWNIDYNGTKQVITTKQEYATYQLVVATIDEAFAPLNGTVLGAVLAE